MPEHSSGRRDASDTRAPAVPHARSGQMPSFPALPSTLRTALSAMPQHAQRAGAFVEARVDKGVHDGVSRALGSGLGRVLEQTKDARWYEPQKFVAHQVFRAIDANKELISGAATGVWTGTRQKLSEKVIERVTPSNFLTALAHPDKTATFFRQKAQPLSQLMTFASNPMQTLSQMAWNAPKHVVDSFQDARAQVSKLDRKQGAFFSYPDPMHAGRAISDRISDGAAGGIAALLVSRAAFLGSTARQNTRNGLDQVISAGGPARFAARQLLKPAMRVAMNPRIAVPFIAFQALSSAGKGINARAALAKDDHKSLEHLAQKGQDYAGAASRVATNKSIAKTSHGPR